MTIAQLIGLAIQLSMATIIFCVALHANFGDVVFLWRRPWLLLRSLLSMLLVMPALAVATAMLFDLNVAVEIALIASALSPVPPILPSKQIKAGGESSYVVGLLTTTALVSILYVPLAAQLLGNIFHRPVDVSPADVAKIVATSMLLPVLAGMAAHKFAPKRALQLDRPLSILATVVLAAACIPILFKEWPDITRMLGNFSLVAMAGFAAGGLVVGHWLGGPDPHERSVLAMATAARHPAVALAISHNAVDKPGVMAAVLLAMIVASIVTLPYVKWRQRGLQTPLAQGHSPIA